LLRALIVAAIALALPACGWLRGPSAPAAPIPPELTGTVDYRERVPLPPDAQLRVRLEELAAAGKPPQFIAETTIPRLGRPPIRFRIALAPGVIDPRRAYILTARIERGEEVLFVNDPPFRVLTGGNPAYVEIVVSPAARGK
jgi:putative lipoprotein